MLPGPHKRPHSVATDVRPFDLGYASLYSRWVEFYIYLVPVCIILSAVFGFISFKAGASPQTVVTITATTLIGGKIAFSLVSWLHPLYQGIFSNTKTTAHVFTADGVELETATGPILLPWNSISKVVETKKGFLFYRDGKLATFLPARNLEGPIEAELIRKFIRHKVTDATLRG
jgi:YcxB-like protein